MTEQEIQIEIGELLGWKRLDKCEDRIGFHIKDKEYCLHWGGKVCEWLPNWPIDLNAMHEAEGTLTNAECDAYGLILNAVMAEQADTHDQHTFCDWHATAAQRAKAFLIIKGKRVEKT